MARTAVLALAISFAFLLTVVAPEHAQPPLGTREAAPGTDAASPEPAVAASAPEATAGASPSAEARALAVEAAVRASDVPSGLYHPPDFSAEQPHPAGPVAPTYTAAPAPMGLADLGLRNVSGSLEPYTLNTPSVEGTVSFTNASPVYLDGDGPDTFGVQLNAVATNVTLFGNSSYEFWAQNFITYTPSSGQLAFGDNVWNFSSLNGTFPATTLYAYGPGGTLVAPYFYYAVGPSFTVHYPFSVTFYLNATLDGGRPAIFFNYTLNSTAENRSGSFDEVVFNSGAGPSPPTAPEPEFQVNGSAYNPAGLLNDFELVVVGNDDGDTTSFFAIHATLALDYWNVSSDGYAPIPSAYDAGADTGETSDGIDVAYEEKLTVVPLLTVEPTAILDLGPSFLYGLWNVSANAGFRTISEDLTPANAFLFVNTGKAFAAGRAQWVPSAMPPAAPATPGNFSFTIPNGGTYFLEAVLSDYRAAGTALTVAAAPDNLTTSVVTTLTRATGQGVYTPLLAWGNAELAAIAASGNGTNASPYVLESADPSRLGAEFTQWNDFQFPVFPGLLLINTSDYVHTTPPEFAISFPASQDPILTEYGLPFSNDLQIELWNVSNVSVLDAPAIAGWLASSLAGFPVGDVIVWGSSGNLIAGNTFLDEGSALALYGGTNNTVWGNTFLATTPPAAIPGSVLNTVNNTTGIYEAESGDLVYNNYFSVPTPAYSPTVDPFSCQVVCSGATYTDRWNVTREAAGVVNPVLGTNLSGSILHTTYQGGNYWSNYGIAPNPYGVLPYNDSGRISAGGDYVPLVPFSLYAVNFTETGLTGSPTWGVVELGTTYRSTAANLTVFAPNGTYNYSVVTPSGYAGPPAANFTVDGSNVTVNLTFAALVPVVFDETGLASSWNWSVDLVSQASGPPGVTGHSTTATVALAAVAGTYTYTISSVGYAARPATGTVHVDRPPPPVDIVFSLVPILEVNATGLAPGTPWTVAVDDSSVWTNRTTVAAEVTFSVLDLAPGAYSWTVSAPNYTASPSHGTGTSPTPSYAPVAFAVIDGTLSGTINVPDATLYVDGALVDVSDGTFSVDLAPGVHAIYATAPGYEPYYNNVTTGSGGSTPFAIVMDPVPAASPGLWGIPVLGWGLILVLAVLSLALLLVALVARRHGRRRPPAAPFVRPAPSPQVPAGASASPPPPPPAAPAPAAPAPVPAPAPPSPEPPVWSEEREPNWKED